MHVRRRVQGNRARNRGLALVVRAAGQPEPPQREREARQELRRLEREPVQRGTEVPLVPGEPREPGGSSGAGQMRLGGLRHLEVVLGVPRREAERRVYIDPAARELAHRVEHQEPALPADLRRLASTSAVSVSRSAS